MSSKNHHHSTSEQDKPSFIRHSQKPRRQPETPLDSQDIDKLLLTPQTAIQDDPARKAYRARLSYVFEYVESERTKQQIQKSIIDVDSLGMAEQSLKNTELLLDWFEEQRIEG